MHNGGTSFAIVRIGAQIDFVDARDRFTDSRSRAPSSSRNIYMRVYRAHVSPWYYQLYEAPAP
ncbi:hypothetical protein CA830_32830, partial [Burkholderia multivorans]